MCSYGVPSLRRAPRPLGLQLPGRRLGARGDGRRGAAELGHAALAITDHDGLCGSLAFAHAARAAGVRPITGAELTLRGRLPPDAAGRRRGRVRQPLPAHHPGPRGHAPAARPPARCRRRSTAPRLAAHAEGLVCLTGCARDGPGAAAGGGGRRREAEEAVRDLVRDFGPGNVHVEIQRPRSRGDRRLARDLARLAEARRRARAWRPATPTRTRPERAPAAGRLRGDPPPPDPGRLRGRAARQPRRGAARRRRETAALFADHPGAVAQTLRTGRAAASSTSPATWATASPTSSARIPGETAQAALARVCALPARRALPQRRASGRPPGCAWTRSSRSSPTTTWPASSCCTATSWSWRARWRCRCARPARRAAGCRPGAGAGPRWARSSATSPASPTSTRSRTASSWGASSTATWPRCPTSTSTSRATSASALIEEIIAPLRRPSTPRWWRPSPPSASAWPSASWAGRSRCPRPISSGSCACPTAGRRPARWRRSWPACRTARPSWPRRAGGRWRSWPARPRACPDTCHSTPAAWS